jgi:hypothetical protein
MAKDRNTPKHKTPSKPEANANSSFVDRNCSQWAIKQSESWEQRMVEHRDAGGGEHIYYLIFFTGFGAGAVRH